MDDGGENYEEVLEGYRTLIRRQQTTIEDLGDKLHESQEKLATNVRQAQFKLDTILEHHENATESQHLEEIKLLKSQLEDTMKEKELINIQNEFIMKEIQSLKFQTSVPMETEDGAGFKFPSSSSVEVIRILEEETERLRRNLVASEEENIKVIKENEQIKNEVKTMQKEILYLKESFEASQRISPDLQSKIVKQDEMIQELKEDCLELQKEKETMQSFMTRVKNKLEEGETKVHESLRLAEEALLEKDAALLREKHSVEDIKRLEDQMKILLEESIQKAKHEVEKSSEVYRSKIKSLSEEIAQLQMNLNSKQIDFERCRVDRDKMAKENELLTRDLTSTKEEKEEESLRSCQRLQELERKISQANIEKENLFNKLSRVNTDFKSSFEETLQRIGELEKRLSESIRENERIKREVSDLQNEKGVLQETIVAEKENFKKRENYLLNQLREKCQHLQRTRTDHDSYFDSMQNTHKKLINQLYSTVEALKKRIIGLQNDHKTQLAISEEIVQHLREDFDEVKSKNLILTKSLQEAETKGYLFDDEIKRNKLRIKTLEDDLANSKECLSTLLKAAKES